MSESDPKTTDYCSVCNQSPESGTHMFEHAYVFPTADDICGCNQPRDAVIHAPGAGHRWYPPRKAVSATLRAGYTGNVKDVAVRDDKPSRASTAPMPGLARVIVESRPGMPEFGVMVGMMLDERGDMQIVVRLDGRGMMLKAAHPSTVTPITSEQEEAYKP